MVKVCKFGGTSMADAAQVKKVCDIVLADPSRRIVVVSAPGKRNKHDTKVTDLLIDCANRALAGQDYTPVLAAIVGRYAEIQHDLKLEPGIVAEIEADVQRRLANRKDHAGMFLDAMKAAGEDNSAKITAAAFRARGVDAEYVDPRDAGMLLTDEFGNAQLLEESYQRLERSLKDRRALVVFPGFFGYTRSGAVATFPRGGSDITGAILAAAVKADVYENFTDVDSVYAVDPRIVPEVKHAIREMTFREMRELSYAGFGVFHDEAVLPAIRAGITINIRNTNRPEAPGTLVVAKREITPGQCAVVGIASDVGFMNIYVDKYLMNREVGFCRRLLCVLEEEGIAIEHMPSGIDNVSVVLRESRLDAAREQRVVARIQAEFQPDNMLVERGHALIMLVGEGMHYTVGMTARASQALAQAGVNIEMLNQGASEISIMFGVKASDRDKAVRALYKAFFE